MPTSIITAITMGEITSAGATLTKVANTMTDIITAVNIITEDAISTMETKSGNVPVINSIIQMPIAEIMAEEIEKTMVVAKIDISRLEIIAAAMLYQ
jgi:hypothetical protein